MCLYLHEMISVAQKEASETEKHFLYALQAYLPQYDSFLELMWEDPIDRILDFDEWQVAYASDRLFQLIITYLSKKDLLPDEKSTFSVTKTTKAFEAEKPHMQHFLLQLLFKCWFYMKDRRDVRLGSWEFQEEGYIVFVGSELPILPH